MENNFKYIVYLTINLVNNKIYVGVHKTKDPKVFDGYIGCGVNINYPSTYMQPKFPFLEAVKKYGTSNFRRTILFVFDNEDIAYTKEREIVNYDFVHRSDTYNCVLGGDLRPLYYYRRKIYLFDIDGKLQKVWNDVYEISEFYCISKEQVYATINCKNRMFGYYWSYSEEIDIDDFSNPNESQKIFMYNLDGKCVAIYRSITLAAYETGYGKSSIFTAIKSCSLYKGFYFSNKLCDEYIPSSRNVLNNNNIYIYNEEGIYESILDKSDFKKYFNTTSNRKICYIINNKVCVNHKYFSFDKNNHIDIKKRNLNCKKIIVHKTNGDFVGEYPSVNATCKALNLDNSTVNRVLRGVYKTTKGYVLKIKDIV